MAYPSFPESSLNTDKIVRVGTYPWPRILCLLLPWHPHILESEAKSKLLKLSPFLVLTKKRSLLRSTHRRLQRKLRSVMPWKHPNTNQIAPKNGLLNNSKDVINCFHLFPSVPSPPSQDIYFLLPYILKKSKKNITLLF